MSLNKKLNKLIDNRPKYNVDGAYAANEAIARNMAYGRDRSSQVAEAANAESLAAAADATARTGTSAAAVAAGIGNLQAGTARANRELAAGEGQRRDAGLMALTGAQTASAEERDKAWNFNVNDPYQNKVANLRDRKKNRQELLMKGIDTVGAIAASAAKAATGGMA